MKKELDIMKWLMPIVVLLATACSHDELVVPDVHPEEKEPPYVEVRIAVPLSNPNATRANPLGGEEGNGRERGLENEDRIHDINLFFFESDGGLNGDDEAELKHLYYSFGPDADPNNSEEIVSAEEEDGDPEPYYGFSYITLKVKYWENDINRCENLKFLAIANFGHIANPGTLGKLRDLPLNDPVYDKKAWMMDDAASRDASGYHHFLMSTAYDAETWYGGQSTGTNSISDDNKGGYSGTTTLQRLSARLDLWYDSEKNSPTGNQIKKGESVAELKYQVVDEEGKDLKIKNLVFLTNILPVNVMQEPSYVFKMVTEGVSQFDSKGLENVLTGRKYLWGGKESPNDKPTAVSPNDMPQNYVIERHTLDKSGMGASAAETWYGNTYVSKVKGKDPEDEGYKDGDNDYSIRNSDIGKISEYYHDSKERGMYDPDYGCDHISIIGYANENTHPTDCFSGNFLTGMAFRAVYVPEVMYSAYGETIDGEGKTTTGLTEFDQTSLTGGKIYRYSPSGNTVSESMSLYFTDKEAALKYSEAHPGDMAVLTEFKAERHKVSNDKDSNAIYRWGLICYYNMWLRHYNDIDDIKADPHPHLPMEYATVRNNIYRVSLDFTGPGDPTPTMREPETMQARIFVRKWNKRTENEALQF